MPRSLLPRTSKWSLSRAEKGVRSPSNSNSEFVSEGPTDAVGQNRGSGQLKGQRSGQCGLSMGTRRWPGLATQIQILGFAGHTRFFRYCSYRSMTTRNNFVQISDKTFSFSEY